MKLAALLVVVCLVAVPAVSGFDTGFHQDMTAAAMKRQGFGTTAVEVAYLTNWFVDFHAFFALQDARDGMKVIHFDSLFTGEHLVHYWKALASNTKTAFEMVANGSTPVPARDGLMVLGASLHAVQDAYAHTNWAELNPRSDDCDCYQYQTMMSFTETELSDLGNELYSGASDNTGIEVDTDDRLVSGEAGDHGDYCAGVNHDSYNRPNFQSAQAFAYAATVEWVMAAEGWLNNATIWNDMLTYNVPDPDDLDEDLKSLFELSAYIHTLNSNDGHWKGAGSGNADQFALELAAFYLDGFSDVHDAFDEFSNIPSSHLGVLSDNVYDFDFDGFNNVTWPPVAAVAIDDVAVVVRTTAAADLSPGAARTDLIATISIDDYTFVEGAQANTPTYADASWTTVVFVDPSTPSVDLEYYLYDAEVPSEVGDRLEIGPSVSGLVFAFNLSSHELSGDVMAVHDDRASQFEAQTSSASVSFYVTTMSACPANTGFENPTPTAEASKQICEPDPVVAFCTEGSDFLSEFWYVWVAIGGLFVVLSVGCCCYLMCRKSKNDDDGGHAPKSAYGDAERGKKKKSKKKSKKGKKKSRR